MQRARYAHNLPYGTGRSWYLRGCVDLTRKSPRKSPRDTVRYGQSCPASHFDDVGPPALGAFRAQGRDENRKRESAASRCCLLSVFTPQGTARVAAATRACHGVLASTCNCELLRHAVCCGLHCSFVHVVFTGIARASRCC
jgi:hypothetical protein